MDTVPDGTFEPVEVVDGVHLAQVAAGEEMSVQHVRIEPGARVPDHSHHHEQAGVIHAGELTFHLDGSDVDVAAGGTYHLASHETHGATNGGNEDVIAIDVFSPPRPNPDWLE